VGGPTLDEIIGRLAVFDGRRVTASRLSGGHMNEVFRVLADDEKYVLHVAAPSGDALVPDRSVVLRNAEAAGATGAAPRLVDRLDDPPVMVVAYVEGEMMTPERLAPAEQVPRVAEVLRRLHAGPRFGNDIDMFATAERWLRVCDERGIAIPEGLREAMPQVRAAARALADRPMASVPSHNDLAPDNLIDDGRRLWLVDFEYSGNNDPCYDVGDVAFESDLDEDWRARLCEAYFGTTDPVLLARTFLHSLIAGVAWAVWASAQRHLSTLDVDYAGIAETYRTDVEATLGSERFGRWLHLVGGRRS
jgi:thiamine kinase-like enzyme